MFVFAVCDIPRLSGTYGDLGESGVYLLSVMTNATGVNYTFQLSPSLLGGRGGGGERRRREGGMREGKHCSTRETSVNEQS